MKKTITLLFLILVNNIIFAQNTYVPDGAFENYLETHNASGALVSLGDPTSMGNGVAYDNYVTTAKINTVTNLDVSSQNIKNMIGIEDFAMLDYLKCSYNQLVSLDVSQNTVLEYLNCSYNQLTYLDVSQNTALIYFWCAYNQLTSLNVQNGNNTNISNFNFLATYNPDLTCIQVDDVANSTANWDGIDPASSFSLNCPTPETYVPDAVFENYLETHDANGNTVALGNAASMGNGIANDNTVFTKNIIMVADLNVNSLNITDLTGIQDFATLLYLNINSNQIINLDLSYNTILSRLYCNNNQITSLNLSQNTALTQLFCHDNQLVALNVQNGNNSNISYFYTNNNPNLSCIQVDDIAYSTTSWTNIDATSSFSLDCHFADTDTYVPDDNFENYLETHNANGDTVALGDTTSMGNGVANDDYVTTANIDSVTSLTVYTENIIDMTGIENFVALQNLYCSSNQIQSLDVSHNTALKKLYCTSNQLQSLDLSQNTALTYLKCFNNSISDLDLSQNTALIYLNCKNNQLTNLNVKNGNNTAITNTFFNAINNPNLTCIEVDDAAWSSVNWTNIDVQTSFSINCSPDTYIPDDNFENYLETHDANGNTVSLGDASSMGNGIANDNFVTTANIDTVTNLNLNNKNIADLTGIQKFTALTILNCENNNLQTIDLTQLTALEELYCSHNILSNFINVSNNIALRVLNCGYNQLGAFDLSNNTALEYFSCYVNQLSYLDLSQNTALKRVKCQNNQLTYLNVQNGNNTVVSNANFITTNNSNLSCILVDNASWSTTNWTHIDATSTFVNSQAACDALYIEDASFENSINIYPNPAKENITIANNGSDSIDKITIYNALGTIVYQTNTAQNSIETSNFKTGVYLVQLISNKKSLTKKLIIRK